MILHRVIGTNRNVTCCWSPVIINVDDRWWALCRSSNMLQWELGSGDNGNTLWNQLSSQLWPDRLLGRFPPEIQQRIIIHWRNIGWRLLNALYDIFIIGNIWRFSPRRRRRVCSSNASDKKFRTSLIFLQHKHVENCGRKNANYWRKHEKYNVNIQAI